jgi:DNA-binding NarL/FixJ family response regulator
MNRTIYDSKEFKKLRDQWYEKLKDTDFNDLEDTRGNLKNPDIRTIAWKNRERISEFYDKLNDYLRVTKGIKRRDRHILKLWGEGVYMTEIAVRKKLSYTTIKAIISKHKKLILQK